MKRLFDIVLSAVGLVALSPLIVLLAILIRRSSHGPAVFAQDRIGREGKIFRCYKLRTMVQGTPNVPTHEASKADYTRIGRILRSFKLDELPQLWNVLTGDMSLVGPRPCLPSQAELLVERRRYGILDVPPGVTGLAQVRGIDMSIPAKLVDADIEYLRNRSFAYDMGICFQTFSVLWKGRKKVSSDDLSPGN